MTGNLLAMTGVLAQATQPAADVMGIWQFIGQIGGVLALGLGALGSAIGIGVAGRAAAGAWAKEAKAGQGLRFTYIILLGMPISQTFYAMIVMNKIRKVLVNTKGEVWALRPEWTAGYAGMLLAVGIATGLAELFSAWMQGKIGASGIRTLSEGEGKGFAFLLVAMGIVESVGIFAMIFMLAMIPKIPTG